MEQGLPPRPEVFIVESGEDLFRSNTTGRGAQLDSPGLAPPVDTVMRWSVVAILWGLAAIGIAMLVVGRDGIITDDQRFFALPAVIAATASFLSAVAAVVEVFHVRRVVRGSHDTRYGLARSAIVAGATMVLVLGAFALAVPELLDARSEGRDVSEAKADEAAAIEAEDLAPIGTYAALRGSEVGTCLRWPEGPTTTERLARMADPGRVVKVPCSLPHGYEVVGNAEYGDGPAAPFPMPLEARHQAVTGTCSLRLLSHLTPEGESTVTSSRFDVYVLPPSPADWRAGQRTATCIAIPPPGVTVERSLRGAG